MRKFLFYAVVFCGNILSLNAWATGSPGGGSGGGSAPEIPAGSGPFVLAAVVGVVFLARYLTRKK